ncbi:MAG: serine/threonine-protein kinase [Cyanobacteria bacterium P01_D01_bin.115]
MSHCLNPDCAQPKNPSDHRFCQRCGWPLRLGDRYEAVSALKVGQNSRTFVGRDRTTLVQPQCLIKQFTPHGETRLEQDTAAERWRRDAGHLATASQHPQIPDVVAYFERDRHQFLVQQFLTGPHLDQILQEKLGPFDSDEVWTFLRDVLPILHHLHQNRIIHRDIKPTNFRRPLGQPHWWLVDLGAIKPLTATRLAQPGTVVGSADYAAPEQLRGEATVASDLYSLGVVCLHLLTGLNPFDLFDSGQGGWHWRSIVPDVSPSLAAILDSMVQPTLRDRLADVATAMVQVGLATPVMESPLIAQPIVHKWQAAQTVDLAMPIVAAVSLPQSDHLLLLTTAGTVVGRSLSTLAESFPALSLPSPQATAIAAHPHDGAFIIGTARGQLARWQWQAESWQEQSVGAIAHGITQLMFVAEGQQLLIADDQGHLYRWDGQTHQIVATWPAHTSKITSLALNHSDTVLASGDDQGQVTLWQWPTMRLLRKLSRQPGAITALTWQADDQTLITAGWDVTVRWRCPQTGRESQVAQAQGFYLPVRSLWSHPIRPDLVTGSQDGHLQYWQGSDEPASPLANVSAAAIVAAPAIALCPQTRNPPSGFSLISVTASGQLAQWLLPGSES